MKLLKLFANAVIGHHKTGDVQHELCSNRAFVCKFQKPGFVCCPISLRFFESRGWAKNAWCDSQDEHSRDHITSTSIGCLHACLLV